MEFTTRTRVIYEDRGSRISIVARANAQGAGYITADCSRPTRKNSLAELGAGHTFGKDNGRKRGITEVDVAAIIETHFRLRGDVGAPI